MVSLRRRLQVSDDLCNYCASAAKKDMDMAEKQSSLTAKQEAFALSYVELGNASAAYREAYDVGVNTKPESIWVNASKTLSDAKVAQRVMELQAEAAERSIVSVQSITAELEEARLLASIEKQSAAMTTAIMGKAKVNGLLVDKKLHGNDPDNPMPVSPVAIYQLPDNGRDGAT